MVKCFAKPVVSTKRPRRRAGVAFRAIAICAAAALLLLSAPAAKADDSNTNNENSSAGFFDNAIIKREIIFGATWSDEKNKITDMQSIGLEVLKRFSDKKGDWASLFVQFHVDTAAHWDYELHDAYFKYTGPYRGRFFLKVGHFDVPFGLETNVDTHMTLVQLMSMRNVGFKRDWGISAGGQLDDLDYEFALTRGMGKEYNERGENYLISGRIGTPADENFSIGLSALYGQVIDPMAVMRASKMGAPTTWFGRTEKPGDDIVRRHRVGADFIALSGPYTFKGEISYGKDINLEVINSILEVDYLFPDTDGRLEGIAQIQKAYQEITASGSNNDIFMTLGLNYRLSHEITLRTIYKHDFQHLKDTENDDVIAV